MTILLDGGMGQELRRRGLNADAKVAGLALLESPTAVRDVHQEYIAAGAQVITTWNYAITPQRLAPSGLRDRLGEMTRVAVEMATQARANTARANTERANTERENTECANTERENTECANTERANTERANTKQTNTARENITPHESARVRIAGSLPPLRASYEPNNQELVSMGKEYAEIAEHLAPGVDLFICETMSSAAEAVAAARAAAIYGKPVWVSWTLRDEGDGRLRSGETIDAALAALKGIPVEALLFNCCDATAITHAMPLLRAATTLPIGAYANAFTPISKDWTRDGANLRDLRDLTPEDYADIATQWRAAGAEIIGGCCGIGPAHIAYLRDMIR